jgi:hypothetical protein
MRVVGSDGEVLGRVARIGQERIYVRKRFSKLWRAVPLSRVARIHIADVCLAGLAAAVAEPVTPEMLAAEIPTYTLPFAEASDAGHAQA